MGTADSQQHCAQASQLGRQTTLGVFRKHRACWVVSVAPKQVSFRTCMTLGKVGMTRVPEGHSGNLGRDRDTFCSQTFHELL